MTRLKAIRIALWVAVAVLTATTVGVFMIRETETPANAAIGGPFTLEDAGGKPVTEAVFTGKPHLIFFGYTHCPDVCPTTLADMTVLLDDLGPAGKDLVIAFITVDPERDTPEVLKSYLSSFSPQIVGLTGTDAEIADVVSAYRAYRRKVPGEAGEYTMDHTASVYLFDDTGDFRGTIDLSETDDVRLAKVKRLLGIG
ncbi:BsSco [Hartmannibacter diazotrophicus]|uniref:BsSco n=1 Tax=Hartmannibacter diazotrophicus TaxID=1482074 RepID=A0A2C9D0S3_9HYPH|nr:SCO family protein [Hartmannibacter diazotrophicus]SON53823.1 BsSco [Hartmannibacter diazotrophicus]